MNILILTLFLNVAYLPDYNIYYGINEKKRETVELTNAYLVEFGIDLYLFNIFFINGSVRNLFHKQKGKIGFYPDHDEYKINVGIRYQFIEIGFEHLCFHPIFPYSGNNVQFDSEPLINNAIMEGSYNKIYFKFEAKKEL